MTTHNYLEQLYRREMETVREISSGEGALTSDVEDDVRAAEMYAFGGDGESCVRAWDIHTEDHVPR